MWRFVRWLRLAAACSRVFSVVNPDNPSVQADVSCQTAPPCLSGCVGCFAYTVFLSCISKQRVFWSEVYGCTVRAYVLRVCFLPLLLLFFFFKRPQPIYLPNSDGGVCERARVLRRFSLYTSALLFVLLILFTVNYCDIGWYFPDGYFKIAPAIVNWSYLYSVKFSVFTWSIMKRR